MKILGKTQEWWPSRKPGTLAPREMNRWNCLVGESFLRKSRGHRWRTRQAHWGGRLYAGVRHHYDRVMLNDH
jgi:hypothetical protein